MLFDNILDDKPLLEELHNTIIGVASSLMILHNKLISFIAYKGNMVARNHSNQNMMIFILDFWVKVITSHKEPQCSFPALNLPCNLSVNQTGSIARSQFLTPKLHLPTASISHRVISLSPVGADYMMCDIIGMRRKQ